MAAHLLTENRQWNLKRWLSQLSLISICLLLFCVSANGFAQSQPGFSLNQFDPSERGSHWFTGESLDLRGHEKYTVGVVGDWAYQPLVAYDQNGNSEAAIVKNQFFAHLGASLVLWNQLRFGINVPVLLFSNGESLDAGSTTLTAPKGAALGDIRIGADISLLGKYGDAFQLAAGLQVHLPSGKQENFVSDGSTQLKPRGLIAGDIGIFAYSASTGFLIRTNENDYFDQSVGSEWQFGGTIGLRLIDKALLLGPELWGSTVISDKNAAFFSKEGTPFEALLGAHYLANKNWTFGLGVGPGFTRGLGSPTTRLLFSGEYIPTRKTVTKDKDSDGIADAEDSCPRQAGPPNHEQVERHGCPLLDQDRDGIFDQDDACISEFGQASQELELHGCPYCQDQDEDGIYDLKDACPTEPGPSRLDKLELHGCPVPPPEPEPEPKPEPDQDQDGFRDLIDACPQTPGLNHDDPKLNGCPRARIEGSDIIIMDRIEFDSRSDAIRPDSLEILKAVASLLSEHPEIEGILIEGHTDSIGSRNYNLKLSQLRARAVLKWLEGNNIEKGRLSSSGQGMQTPIDTNETVLGRQNNRRVEFHIVQQGETHE